MTTTMVQRVAEKHLVMSSAKDEAMWASREISKLNHKLESVYLALTARGSGSSYEGNESLADGDDAVSRAAKDLQSASALLANASDALRARSSSMPRAASEVNSLDGMDKRTGLRRINAVIAATDLKGFFNDDHWEPVQKLWKNFAKAGISVNITNTFYTKDTTGEPDAKTWKFTVEWTDARGKPMIAYGQVIASGSGTRYPLDTYDVVAYAS